jgi:hypothetical protein
MGASRSLRSIGVIVLAGSILATRVARADDPAAAEALFREGKQLMKEGRLDAACRKLEESQALDPGVGTLFNLALCYEAQGRVATAWATYNEVAAQTRATGQAERAQVARDRGLVLEPRLSYATIRVQAPGTQGLEVRRDGVVVGPSQWGTPIPVDPGAHGIEAAAPGYAKFSTSFDVRGDAQRVDVAIPTLIVEPAPSPAAPSRGDSVRVDPNGAPPAARSSLRIPLAIAAASIGALGLGIGTYFGVLSLQQHAQAASSGCEGNACQEPGYDLRESAIRSGNASTASFAVGVAGLVGGAAILLLMPSAAGPRVAVHADGIDVGVRW